MEEKGEEEDFQSGGCEAETGSCRCHEQGQGGPSVPLERRRRSKEEGNEGGVGGRLGDV